MNKKIIFTGGGTGGHVYPAIAIIETLKKEGYDISWIGSKNGIEFKIISELNIPFFSIPSGKLRRYFSIKNFFDIFKIMSGFIKSFIILLKIKPDLIFSKGGYVTVPPIICAKLLGIKCITHESDFSPGLATKINSRFVDKILIPYNETKDYFSFKYFEKLEITGNPVREEFYNASAEKGFQISGFTNSLPLIVVLGGSLGAKEINDILITNKDYFKNKFNIYHQMGQSNFIPVNDENYKTVPYINNGIADLIKASTIVISRSGAGATWEFATVGTPAIYIPFSIGSRGDQLLNAKYFENENLAKVLESRDLTFENLIKKIDEIIQDSDIKRSNFNKYINIKATNKICSVIKELV